LEVTALLLDFLPADARAHLGRALEQLGEEPLATEDGSDTHDCFVARAQDLLAEAVNSSLLEQLVDTSDTTAGWGDGFWFCRRGRYSASETRTLRRLLESLAPHCYGHLLLIHRDWEATGRPFGDRVELWDFDHSTGAGTAISTYRRAREGDA
jgi:hypothetical protein